MEGIWSIGLGLTSKGQCGLAERTNWGSWDQWRNPGLYMYHYWTIEVTRRLKPGSYSDMRIVVDSLINLIWFLSNCLQSNRYLSGKSRFVHRC